MSASPSSSEESQIPIEISDVLNRLPGTDHRDSLEEIYRAARRSGGLILLVRPSIRATVAAVLGTFASGAGRDPARVYAVDTNRERLTVLFRELSQRSLASEITLYHGSLREFFRDLPLGPDLVCADLENGESDGILFRRDLPAQTEVVIFRAAGNGVQSAAAQALVDRGILECSGAAYRATRQCQGAGIVPRADLRIALQGRLHQRYFLPGAATSSSHTPVSDITEDIRREFSVKNPGSSGYGQWPYVNREFTELPRTLPSGKAWPKISVVTPTFNQGKYIEQTILSVLRQGYPNVEYIIVDGASTDETPQILERYRDKIALIISEPDRGQSEAINKGMAKASGDILTWVNSDDMLTPGALAAAAMAFETSAAEMIAGICQLYLNGRMVGQHLTCCADGPLPLDDLLDLDHCWNAGQFFHQPEVMFSRELWLRAGGRVSEHLYYSMDYELWLRFAKAGAKLHVIGRPMAWFRIHEEQKTYQASDFMPELVTCRDAFLSEHGIATKPAEQPPGKRRQLRVTLLNDVGGFYGAGIAHVRLARALAWAGHEVSLVSILDRPGVPGRYTVQGVADRVSASHPDLVIVGNLHSADVDPMLLHLLCARFPTLVVLHDFWILTGRCAYTGGCEKYLTGCDATCPTPNEYPALAPAEIADAWLKKRALLRADSRLALLANSQWTAGFARNTFAKPSRPGEKAPPIEVFQLSFPLDIFRPRDKRVCREALGLPPEPFIVLLPGSLQDPRKGGRALLDALSRLRIPGLLVVILGAPTQDVETPLRLVQLGHIDDQQRVAMLYSAADVVAVPSSAETFGQVLIEAIACGTPVAGYPVTAVREAVRDGITGVIAEDTNPASLAAAIHYLYSHPEVRRDIARWGRVFVENEWSEFSAYRHLFLALRRLKLADALHLQRKIGFLSDAPAPPPMANAWDDGAAWRPSAGFSGAETATHAGLEVLRWAFGPEAFAEVSAAASGVHRVFIAYRNPHDGQRLTLKCNDIAAGDYDLPRTGFEAGRFLLVNLPLRAGVNQLHLKFSKWSGLDSDNRPLALIVTDISIEQAVVPPAPERMLAHVWGSPAL